MNSEQIIKTFISYSHDSSEHMDRVLNLSDRLRQDGIDCHIDQYETSPAEGWPRWMINQVEAADFVLVVCTETYNLRFRGKAPSGTGKGAKWEGAIITQEIYDAEAKNTKFIPVLFSPEDETHIPTILRGASYYDLSASGGYEKLYRRLTDQPETSAPPLGRIRPMPPRKRSQDFQVPHGALLNVPPRNNFFTGREEVLEKLRAALTKGGTTALSQAISGLGGVGKTQTAIEYAYRFQDEYQVILWAKAESADALATDFVALAGGLGLREKDAKEQEVIVRAVLRWLEGSDGWLLILDNADTPEVVKEFLPRVVRGHILLTSRAHHFGILGIARPLSLEEMPEGEALEFLFRRTGRSLAEADTGEKQAAEALARELGFLPLALEQAGAFIAAHDSRFQSYLDAYRTRRLKLLEESGPVAGDYKESVATTWAMNFEEVEGESKASADLLRFSAFLAPDDIPLELVAKGASELGDAISKVLADGEDDPLALDRLLEPLTRYSLIQRNLDENTYSIHRLVQEVIKARMDDKERRAWAERTVLAINAAFPYIEFENWSVCERLLPHGREAARLIEEWSLNLPQSGRLLNQLGCYLHGRARYAEAEPLMRRALAIDEVAYGPEHSDVARDLNNLAQLLQDTNRLNKAEPLLKRALGIVQGVYGPEHPKVAIGLNNLAGLLQATNRLKDAEPLMRWALAIDKAAYGLEHPNVAIRLNNLAGLLKATNRLEEAEPLMRRVVEITEKSLGPDHPNLATALNNLAGLLRMTNRMEEGEPLCRRAVEIAQKSLGEDHPSTRLYAKNLEILMKEKDEA